MSLKKIIFFKAGSFSHINEAVLIQLKKNFPNHQIETCDVLELMDRETSGFANKLSLIKEYGLDILRKEKYWKSWLFCTSNIFLKIRKKIRSKFKDTSQIAFTFQTQSLFDASIPGVPHFVYADSTVLANYSYPNISPASFLKSKKWMKLEKEIYQNASHVFLFSSNQVDSVIADYGLDSGKATCVYAGANIDIKELTKPASFSNHILFVGVDWERKGGPTLWNALQKLDVPFKLTVVGCSPDIKDTRVNIVGRIPINEVAQYFQEADIFCTPTNQEPFGIVFLEAMHYQLPVVSTNIGALPDMVLNDKTGLLVNPGDAKSLALALSQLLNNKDLCFQMGVAGKKRAKEIFNWKSVGTKISLKINEYL
jgi:glycosyltransferase involved in cell wall biosynthesis